MKAVPSATRERKFVGVPTYVFSNDSLELEGLPIGMYMLEIIPDNKNVRTRRVLLNVTNLVPVLQELPDDHVRIAVLNATTGHPVPNAKVRLRFYDDDEEKEKTEVYTCGANGELEHYFDDNTPRSIYVFTKDDVYFNEAAYDTYYNYYTTDKTSPRLHLFTDRSIYRPNYQDRKSVV